ncbi:serine/threonine-protein kinase [Kitasatospora sp. NPDC088134]|uniref:serine/threonine-protein kinase n=1 Tax=Kitasatospora sp. NPDC088134 TaxID=3364071 RepID=UPI003815FC59
MTPYGGAEGAGFDPAGGGAEPLDADDPRAIGPVPLLGRLGAGGMGRVYLGVVGGRYAAVKQLLPQFIEDPDFRRHFGHELDNLARLPAAATAPLLAADREARPPWLATAYIPGLTLDRVLVLNGGPLDAARLWLLLREAATGLQAVHELDMIHRDLKPSNVMLTVDGATLIDFGIARAADQSRLTRTGTVLGTPAYMAPEQAERSGPATSAADVFALGSLIAYAGTGTPPFGEGSGVDMLYRIVHTEPDLAALRELGPDLAETVAACLDKNPAARPGADRLVRLAAEHAPAPGVGWPEPVTDLLRARAAFAARPVPAAFPAAPDRGPATERRTVVLRGTGPEAATGPDPAPGRRRHRRLVPLVVPLILVAGTTAGVELLPRLLAPQGGKGAPSALSPAAAGTVGSSAAATSSGGPSGTPDPGPAATAPPATASSDGGAGNGGDGGNTASPGSTANTRTGAGSGAGSSNGGSGGSGGGGGGGKPAPAPAATPAPAPSPTPAQPTRPRCVYTTSTTCSSDDPTVEVTSSGGWTSCTFTFTTNWGDGTTTYTDTNGTGSTDVHKVYATHRYAAPGSYTINIRAVTTSGLCLATGGTLNFTLES